MTALRVFPFIGALVAVVAVVLAIIGVSTDYWSATDMKTHGGRRRGDPSLAERTDSFAHRSLAVLPTGCVQVDERWTSVGHGRCSTKRTDLRGGVVHVVVLGVDCHGCGRYPGHLQRPGSK